MACSPTPQMTRPIGPVYCHRGTELDGWIGLVSGTGDTVVSVPLLVTVESPVRTLDVEAVPMIWALSVETARRVDKRCVDDPDDLAEDVVLDWHSFEELEGIVEIDGSEATWETNDNSIHYIGNGTFRVSWWGVVVEPLEYEGDPIEINDQTVEFEVTDFRVLKNPSGD